MNSQEMNREREPVVTYCHGRIHAFMIIRPVHLKDKDKEYKKLYIF